MPTVKPSVQPASGGHTVAMDPAGESPPSGTPPAHCPCEHGVASLQSSVWASLLSPARFWLLELSDTGAPWPPTGGTLLESPPPAMAQLCQAVDHPPQALLPKLVRAAQSPESQAVLEQALDDRRRGRCPSYQLGLGEQTLQVHPRLLTDTSGSPALSVGSPRLGPSMSASSEETSVDPRPLYRTITDHLPLGLAVINAQRKIVEANPLLRQWYSHVDFTTQPSCRVLMPGITPPCKVHECACFPPEGAEAPNERRLEVSLPSGTRTFRFTFCPLHMTGNTRKEVILLLEDVTESLAVAAQLQRSQKLESLGTLAGGIAHEINQPLNALQLYGSGLEMLLEANPTLPSDRIQERLRLMLGEANKIHDIITHMRSLSQKDEALGVQAVDLKDCVDGALRLVRVQMAAHHIDLGVHIEHGLPPVQANPVQLEQVCINLVMNAMQALDTLPHSPARPKQIKVLGKRAQTQPESSPPAQPLVEFVVQDNGPGLGDSEERLFDPFFTTKQGGASMGLGLSIVHTLSQSWEATIAARSLQGGGAEFTLLLQSMEEA